MLYDGTIISFYVFLLGVGHQQNDIPELLLK